MEISCRGARNDVAEEEKKSEPGRSIRIVTGIFFLSQYSNMNSINLLNPFEIIPNNVQNLYENI